MLMGQYPLEMSDEYLGNSYGFFFIWFMCHVTKFHASILMSEYRSLVTLLVTLGRMSAYAFYSGGSLMRILQTDPILSFLHTFSPKSACCRGRRSPSSNGRSSWHHRCALPPPPMGPNSLVFAYLFTEKHLCQRLAHLSVGNPGSTTGSSPNEKSWICPCFIIGIILVCTTV